MAKGSPAADSSNEIHQSNRREVFAAFVGIGAASLAACVRNEGNDESTASLASAISGSGSTGVLTLASAVSAGATSATLASAGIPTAMAARVWVAFEPYTSGCEVVLLTGAGTSITFSPALSSAHAANTVVAIVEDRTFTPQLFGATADGTADCSAATNAAISAAHNASLGGGSGGTVFLPPGTYKLTSKLVLTEGVNLVGAGDSSVLVFSPSIVDDAILWSSATQPPTGAVALNARASQFRLTAGNANPRSGIRIKAGWHATIDKVHINGYISSTSTAFTTAGLWVEGTTSFGCAAVTISDSIIERCNNDGIYISGSAAQGVWIERCDINTNGGHGIEVTATSPSSASPSVYIERCIIEGSSKCQITGSFFHSRIIGNFIESPSTEQSGGRMIEIASPQTFAGLEISHNTLNLLYGNGPLGSSQYGIDIEPSSAAGLTVIGNIICNSAHPADLAGAYLANVAGVLSQGNVPATGPAYNNRMFNGLSGLSGLVVLGESGTVQGVVGLSGTNTAANNFSGQVTFSGSTQSQPVTFAIAEADTSYRLLLTPATLSTSPPPAVGSNRVLSVAKTTSGFTANIEAPPGSGASITFDWLLVR